ncbi:uncharacterized protein SPAPADRAFT_48626 [Spathaspora passalidarum NRRL Y-27907]|uniref:Uncharacterized protein n=1 Tax=Spathaspora passalidarum (strain NRRL Y-27907 / 11-Y1) TaxID=619300 RepID=G3AEM7_SPAPN|nr:uncharacterized protein SPAPADRAFT_48626 [Spathaspora passalidarum NRRL Y-27907]EGW35653.1 hypothetical protein SPAPADRAFT_48626 [Spathaspora passalidarum NRRL Y-27907]
MESTNARDIALQRELASLKRINSTVATLSETIKKTGSDIESVKLASDKSLQLISKYGSILRKACSEQQISDEMEEYGFEDPEEDEEEELERQISTLDQVNVQLTEELDRYKQKRTQGTSADRAAKRRKELGLDYSRTR